MQIPILQKFKNSQNEKPGKGSRLVRSLMKIITTIFCVSAALVFIVNIIITKVNIEDEKQRLFEQTVQYYTAEVSGWMDVQIQQLKLMQHKLQSFAPQDLTYANIMPVVQNATEYGQERGVVSDYVVLNTKEIISGDGGQAEAGYDATKNEYYIKPQSMDVYVSEPYIDTVSHDFVITISVPIQIDGKFYGVLARDVSIAAVQEILHSYEETEGSYLYLLDAKGGILIHENEAYETRSSQLITVSDVGMTSMQEAIGKTTIEKDYDGENKYFFAEQEPDSGWIVGIAYPQKAVRHDIITQVLCSLVFFVAAVVIGLFILTSIMRKKFLPIYDVTNAAKQLEYGNFDIHLNVNSQDELGDLALSFEDTGDYLRSVIKEISNILQELSKGNLTVKTTLEYRGEFVTVQTAIHHIIRQMNEVMYNIEMAGEPLAYNQAANIEIAETGEGVCTFMLPDFQFMGLSLGDIVVENVSIIEGEDGVKTYSGSTPEDGDLVLVPNVITASVSLSGTIDASGNCDFDINVLWKEKSLPISVTFTTEMVGTDYEGYLNVSSEALGGQLVDNQKDAIRIAQTSDNTCTFMLNDLTLSILGSDITLGDIVVDNVNVVETDGVKHYNGTAEGLQLVVGPVNVEVEGTIDANNICDFKIDVDWNGMPINVTFTANKIPAGIEGVSGDAVAVYGVVGAVSVNGYNGVVEVYAADGRLVKSVMVDGNAEISLNGGLYIVRAGSEAYKVFVK